MWKSKTHFAFYSWKTQFDKEIVPVEVKDRKGTQIFSKDEYIKAGSTVEGIQKLRAAFKEVGFIRRKDKHNNS